MTEVHFDDTIMAGSTLLPEYAIETKRAAIFSLFSSIQGAAYAPIFYVRIRRNFPLPKWRGVRGLFFVNLTLKTNLADLCNAKFSCGKNARGEKQKNGRQSLPFS